MYRHTAKRHCVYFAHLDYKGITFDSLFVSVSSLPSLPSHLQVGFPFLPPPLEVPPPIAARESGEADKLPQRVRADPGRQTYFGAFCLKFEPF